MAATNITMRMDENLKAQAEELGEQRIPFNISREILNDETIEAIEEVQQIKKNPAFGKTYTDVDDMMKELLS